MIRNPVQFVQVTVDCKKGRQLMLVPLLMLSVNVAEGLERGLFFFNVEKHTNHEGKGMNRHDGNHDLG